MNRKVRIAPTQLHAYYVIWFEGKKQNWENVGSDALTAWQCKLNREAIMNGAPREPRFSLDRQSVTSNLLGLYCNKQAANSDLPGHA